MNPEIVFATIEQRLRSPVRLLLAGMFMFGGAMPYVLMSFSPAGARSLYPTSHGGLLALVFAAGVLGQEFSSGAPQLTFTRPLQRWVWVLSRALAVGLLAAACAVLPFFAAMAVGVPAGDVALAVVEQVVQALGTTALVVGLSALVPGLTDLALIAVANLGLNTLALSSNFLTNPAVRETVLKVKAYGDPWITPKLPLVGLLHGATFSWHDLFVLLSTALFWLVVAIALVNRKELSYATD